MSATANVAHFVVTGEFLTRTARDLFLSDRPAAAYRLLSRGLQGDTVEKVAPTIIDGRSRLTGDSRKGIGVRTERKRDAEAFRKQAHYIYAGRVRIDEAWFRPRAEVVDFGPGDFPIVKDVGNVKDVETDTDGFMESLQIIRDFYRSRVAFYAREGERVVEIVRSKGMPLRSIREGARVFLIFEAVSEPPFWWDEHTSPQAAVEDFFAPGRKLQEESWKDRFTASEDENNLDDFVMDERVTEDREEAREALRLVERRRAILEIREKILAQAGDDLFEMTIPNGPTLRVPRAPFECWALRRTSLMHMAPSWTPVSPTGLKLPLDDPFHTDWWLGAGLDLDGSVYSGPIHDAALEAMFKVQERAGRFDVVVLSDGGLVHGVVGKDIVVVPDLHPDRIDVVTRPSVRAVITETGGQLAHLAQVASEKSITMLRVPDAMRRFVDGMILSLDPEEGRVSVFAPKSHDAKQRP